MPWYVRARMLLIISRTLARPSIFTLLMVLFAGTLVAGPAFCIPSSISSSNRIDMRIDIEMFFLFPSDNKERRRRRAEAKWKKQTEATGFCLYSVNRVDPSLAPIFPPNSELRKTLKKRDVLAAPDVSTSSSGNLLAKVVSRVVFLFK